MSLKITVSDTNAKQKCIQYLETLGFENLEPAKRDDHCDIIGYKNEEKYHFEIKYSSKPDGERFFGTVMLTELWSAVQHKTHYRFIVCRGSSENIADWFFKIYEVDEFIQFCTLTTPIFHYHLHFDENKQEISPKHKETTIKASDNLVNEMWKTFQKWKKK
jgi:hypothetical protein